MQGSWLCSQVSSFISQTLSNTMSMRFLFIIHRHILFVYICDSFLIFLSICDFKISFPVAVLFSTFHFDFDWKKHEYTKKHTHTHTHTILEDGNFEHSIMTFDLVSRELMKKRAKKTLNWIWKELPHISWTRKGLLRVSPIGPVSIYDEKIFDTFFDPFSLFLNFYFIFVDIE